MIKVLRHGNSRQIKNPVTGEWQTTTMVTFVEEGRGGANEALNESSSVLNQAVGKQTGLNNLRVHTQPVLDSALGDFPVNKTFPQLFINRRLFSFPQLAQQVNVAPRMIDGRPTYFTTSLSTQKIDDEDHRISNDSLARINPNAFMNAIVQATEVQIVEQEVVPQQVEPAIPTM